MNITSTDFDMECDMKNMVLSFRVTELSMILGMAGLCKSGRKHELMTRALQLLKSRACSRSIKVKIIDLFVLRNPTFGASMRLKYSDIINDSIDVTAEQNLNVPQQSFPREKIPSGPRFKPLPFFDYISDILPSKPLDGKLRHSSRESQLTFHLSNQQSQKIKSGLTKNESQSKYDIQVQLRFCLLNHTSVQEDVLPPNLVVKLNRAMVTLPPYNLPSSMSVMPKRQNLPIDITPWCRIVPISHRISQVLEVKWSHPTLKSGPEPQKYAITVNLVQKLYSEDLMRKLSQTGPTPSIISRNFIKQKLIKDPESDVSTTSLKVSLICPLGKMRMKNPVRPLSCAHLQCFDANLYFLLNEKKPTWLCPVCNRKAEFSDLRLDGMFIDILKTSNSDEIYFTEDGDWHDAKENKKSLALLPYPIDLSQSRNDSVVILDDAPPKVQNEVIDLTGDSDDDQKEVYQEKAAQKEDTAQSGFNKTAIQLLPCKIEESDESSLYHGKAPHKEFSRSSSQDPYNKSSPLRHRSRSPVNLTSSSSTKSSNSSSLLDLYHRPHLKQTSITSHFPRISSILPGSLPLASTQPQTEPLDFSSSSKTVSHFPVRESLQSQPTNLDRQASYSPRQHLQPTVLDQPASFDPPLLNLPNSIDILPAATTYPDIINID